MSRKHAIFRAGFAAAFPLWHYRRSQLAEQLFAADEKAALSALPVFSSYSQSEYDAHLNEAISLGRSLRVNIGGKPENNSQLLSWFEAYVQAFEAQFPMSRIDHYYFLFPRKLAEMKSDLHTCAAWAGLQATFRHSPFTANISLSIHDAENRLMKVTAAAALLGGEPGHYYFNTLYSELRSGFSTFRLNVNELDRNGLLELASAATGYAQKLSDGLEKCDRLLLELKV